MMKNIFKKMEEAMVAAAFAEAGEHEFACKLVANAADKSRKKVLLSTDCPIVTGEVLDHAMNLCRRLNAALEVYQIIPPSLFQEPARELIETGTKKLQALRQRLCRHGIAYEYAIKEATLEEELKKLAVKRRNLQAIIIPMCEGGPGPAENFRSAMRELFPCPVIFFEA
ncbi:MAG: hypothetical protein SCH71_02575 [Desulfobulbaceae bacterium]|nr:hypothetical protein [Desulfobulbaceae bacterium]